VGLVLPALKDENFADAEVFLFYKCSLNCAFCKQPHKSDVGLTFESLAKKKEILMDFYRNIKAENVLTTILGGETFDDSISNEFLLGVLDLVVNSADYGKLLGKNVSFDMASNLIFKNWKRVKYFIEAIRLCAPMKLVVSYDLADRNLTEEQEEIFKENEKNLESLIDGVNFVLTNNTITRFLDGDIPAYFYYLLEKYPVNFSIVKNNLGVFGGSDFKKLIPSTGQLLSFVRLVKDHPKFSKFSVIKEWKGRANKEVSARMECGKESLVVTPENDIMSCTESRVCRPDEMLFDLACKKQCLSCEYLKHCSVDCALKEHSKEEECSYRQIYDILKEID